MSDNQQTPEVVVYPIKPVAEPMHSGRITNMLYGGFIEVLDDLIPGMWAEMLNDRGFEGVTPTRWFYYTGELNTVDRQWDTNDTWSRDTVDPYNGDYAAKIVAKANRPGSITQGEMYAKTGQDYAFYGYFKTDSPSVRIKAILKALLPDGTWMILGSTELSTPSNEWTKLEGNFKSIGTTEDAVFELEVSGEGTVWADRLSLMPTDNMRGWRKDVVEVIKESNQGVIRFGGSLLEFGYKWEHSVGPRDQRVNYYNQYWGRTEYNDVGIDEFLQFCEIVDVEPLMCLSFAAGWESARDLLEYCNGSVDTKWGKERANNGHPEPYNVKYWQIGNEQAGEDYVKGCPAFFEALVAFDPNLILISSDNSPEILNAVGKYISYTCRHHYNINDMVETENDLIEAQKKVGAVDVGHDIKLAVTEWNTTASNWGLGRGKMLTLGVGLTTAKYVNMMHRHSDFAGLANRSNMTNCMGSGFIVTKQSAVLKTPAYLVMKLFADHYKPVPVNAPVEVEGLDVSACRTEDSKKLTIFAVNTTDKPIEVELDLSAYAGKSIDSIKAVADTQDRKQPDLMNHWKTPKRVDIIDLKFDGNKITLPAFTASAIECA